MFKIKTFWYSQLNKDKNLLSKEKSSEKHTWKMIVSGKYDDVKPFLDPVERSKLDLFAKDLLDAIEATAKRMHNNVEEWKLIHGNDSRKFAQEFQSSISDPVDVGIYWKLFQGKEAFQTVLKVIAANTQDKKHLATVRHLAGNILLKNYKSTGNLTTFLSEDIE